jgi:beta-lactamase class A
MVFPAASTIKIAVLLELLRQGQEGTIALDRPIAIDPAKRVEGGGIMQTWRPPYPPLGPDALAVLMMDDSDNFATNVLIDLVGMERVQARLAGWGLRDTRLQRRMLDLEAARAGRENLTTAREIAGLVARLRLGELLDAGGTRRALAILAANDGAPIDRALPDEVAVAEKEGQLEGVEGSVAIVEIPGRPFVVAVLTTYLDDRRAGQEFIGDVAVLAWRYLGTLAASSEHGRRMEP